MKTITIIAILIALGISGAVISQAYAQTETIASETVAKEIAESAGGKYTKGAAAPMLSGDQVALPVINEATNEVMGYIVANQSELVAALNAAGFNEVAAAIAATEAGTVAGSTVATGVGVGTATAAAVGAAVVVGLAVSSSGSSSTTTHHATSSHH